MGPLGPPGGGGGGGGPPGPPGGGGGGGGPPGPPGANQERSMSQKHHRKHIKGDTYEVVEVVEERRVRQELDEGIVS